MAEHETYRYAFADGTVSEVSESADWIALLQKLDRMERNNDQTEHRRHCSLSRCRCRPASSGDPYEELWAGLFWEELCRELEQQEALVGDLYFRQGWSQKEIARLTGRSQTRVSQILRQIQRLAKRIFLFD